MSLLGQATIGTKKVKYNKKVRLETKRFTFFPVKIKQKTLQIWIGQLNLLLEN